MLGSMALEWRVIVALVNDIRTWRYRGWHRLGRESSR
jgi:hypothetical protein